MAKSSIHVTPMRTFSVEQANENERRWTAEQYLQKNKNSDNHYDITRSHLNFEIIRDKENGELSVVPLQTSTRLDQRLQNRLDELNFKPYKDGARNDPFSCMDWVFGGDTTRMRELAFDKQDVDFDLKRDNSHITRHDQIENWAKDVYNFVVEEFGQDNVIGIEVHLDETTPHAHVLVVPTAMRKQRGRIKAGTERKEKLMVSFSGKCGDNDTERAEYTSRIHTEFAEKVGHKYNLERGDVILELSEEEQAERIHKNKKLLRAEKDAKKRAEKALQEEKEAKERKKELSKDIAEREQTLGEMNASILAKGKSAVRELFGLEQSKSHKANVLMAEADKKVEKADQRAAKKYLPMIAEYEGQVKDLQATCEHLQHIVNQQKDYADLKGKVNRLSGIEKRCEEAESKNEMLEAAIEAASEWGLPVDSIKPLSAGKSYRHDGTLTHEGESIHGRWNLLLQKVGNFISLQCHMGWYSHEFPPSERPNSLYYLMGNAWSFIKTHLQEWKTAMNKFVDKQSENINKGLKL